MLLKYLSIYPIRIPYLIFRVRKFLVLHQKPLLGLLKPQHFLN
ncbi:hypothetical protein NCDO763_0480 [Lactococcus cremoris]|nr:hypothetical protein NCDO763_0480 [Lactococcus cremoris]